MFWKTKKRQNRDETETVLGDGKAEILGAGTYEDYIKESELERSWSQIFKNRLKIDQ